MVVGVLEQPLAPTVTSTTSAASKPLSYVVVKGRANNKIVFMRRSGVPVRRQEGDRLAERQTEIRGHLLSAIEHLNLLIKATEAGHEIFTPHKPDPFAYLSEEEYQRAELEWRQTYFIYLPIGLPGKDVYREYRRDPDTKKRSATNCLVNWRVDNVGFYELYDADELRKVVKTLQERLLGNFEATSSSYLDIASKLQVLGASIPKPPPRRFGDDNSTRPFSQNGRDTLLESGAVIDRACGLNAVEVTLTLPGSTDESMRALAACSGWLVNNLFQVVRDWKNSHVVGVVDADGVEIVNKQWRAVTSQAFEVSASEPFISPGKVTRRSIFAPSTPKELQPKLYYFYAWEFQRRGALHLHICLAAPPEEVPLCWLERLGHLVKDTWFDLLKRMGSTEVVNRYGKQSGRLPGIDMFERNPSRVYPGEPASWREHPEAWQFHVMKITKSVAGYFAKYAGKGAAAAKLKKGEENAFCPARWWGCSRETKQRIQEYRFEYTIPYSWQDDTELTALLAEVLNQYRPVIDHTVDWLVKATYTETFRDYDLIEGKAPQLVLTGERSRQRERVLVNGTSRYLYFAPDEFPDAWGAFRDLKPCFEELAASSYDRRIDGVVKVEGVNPDTNEIVDGYQYHIRQHWLAMQDPALRAIRRQAEENERLHDNLMWTVLLNNFDPKPEVKRPSFSDVPMEEVARIFDELAEIERS